jgi:hypothetical protein
MHHKVEPAEIDLYPFIFGIRKYSRPVGRRLIALESTSTPKGGLADGVDPLGPRCKTLFHSAASSFESC